MAKKDDPAHERRLATAEEHLERARGFALRLGERAGPVIAALARKALAELAAARAVPPVPSRLKDRFDKAEREARRHLERHDPDAVTQAAVRSEAELAELNDEAARMDDAELVVGRIEALRRRGVPSDDARVEILVGRLVTLCADQTSVRPSTFSVIARRLRLAQLDAAAVQRLAPIVADRPDLRGDAAVMTSWAATLVDRQLCTEAAPIVSELRSGRPRDAAVRDLAALFDRVCRRGA